jgi:hypothetical protein
MYLPNWVKSILAKVIFTLKLQNLEIVIHFIPQGVRAECKLLKNDQSARGDYAKNTKNGGYRGGKFLALKLGGDV